MTNTITSERATSNHLGQSLDERLIASAVSALELYSIYIGRRLGLYQALKEETMTAAELARSTGIDSRYAREWLEQQAVAGFLTVDNPGARAEERLFRLDGHAVAVFTDADDLAHLSPLADMVVGVGGALDKVVDAYRTGSGVPFAKFGKAMRDGQGGINRPSFTHDLVGTWIGAVDGLTERLSLGGRIADLGCGVGWSTIALASGIPRADVVGWDSDAASIRAARANAASAQVAARFEVADASDVLFDGPYDLITILEALHDMPQPGAVLEAARGALAADGLILVADEKVADQFVAPGDDLERMMYGWSVTHCLPTALSEQPSAAIGTVIRASIVRDLALQAGFESVEILDVEAGFFRLYVIR